MNHCEDEDDDFFEFAPEEDEEDEPDRKGNEADWDCRRDREEGK